tara:strand:+ start:17754 stop:18083 length:330 start_codon:yes stop_codon:yes gene_type:complete
MKLLIDNNLSVLVKQVLDSSFPGSMHVSEVNLTEASDSVIWLLAGKEYNAILTKDRDFYYRVSLNGAPPKVIWIKRGNCRNKEMLDLIRGKIEDINSFLKSDRDIMTIQ